MLKKNQKKDTNQGLTGFTVNTPLKERVTVTWHNSIS